jgi:predicted transcriptional regulator of viral defense system
MHFQEIYKSLVAKKYYIFSFEELCVFYPEEKRSNLRQYLSRWKKQGWIRSLRRGLYELTYPEGREVPDFYIANKMYAPSYISLETALSYYSIIPEVSMAVVSITAKITRRFKNAHGLFLYRSVRPEAFRGYVIEKHKGLDVLIAEPEKALIDFLYFKTLHGATFDSEAERIDRDRVKKFNKKKMNHYAKIYQLNVRELLYA